MEDAVIHRDRKGIIRYIHHGLPPAKFRKQARADTKRYMERERDPCEIDGDAQEQRMLKQSLFKIATDARSSPCCILAKGNVYRVPMAAWNDAEPLEVYGVRVISGESAHDHILHYREGGVRP